MERWPVRITSPHKPASWCCAPAAAPSMPPSPRTPPSRSWPDTAAGSAAMPSGSSGTRSMVRPSRSTAADALAVPPPSKRHAPSATSRCPNEAPGPSPCPARSTHGVRRTSASGGSTGRSCWRRPSISPPGSRSPQSWLEAVERSALVFGDDGDWASVYRPEVPTVEGRPDRSAAGAGEDLAGALRRGS